MDNQGSKIIGYQSILRIHLHQILLWINLNLNHMILRINLHLNHTILWMNLHLSARRPLPCALDLAVSILATQNLSSSEIYYTE